MRKCAPGSANCRNNTKAYGGVFDLAGRENRLKEIEAEISAPEAWNDQKKMTALLKEKSRLEEEINVYTALRTCRADVDDWLTLAEEGEDEEALASLDEQIGELDKLLNETELSILLSDEADHMDAIMDIHPGAGGTEAQDWAAMLQRMYVRYAEYKKFKVEILDELPGDEAGIKSVTMRIQGTNAFGFLKGEKGIHRLIRISPYDASGRRHTSFASIDIIPDAGDEINIEVKEEDLRIDVYRSSGAGGQHVNKTESAVRMTHLPTGIVATCQNERSQQSNREACLRILKARLYEHERMKREAARQAEYASKDAIAFGSQIRTYTLQPYRLVKDHRSNSEMGDVDAVLDGKIDSFVRDYLLWNHERMQKK